jgi:transposase-like protein
MNSKDPFKWRQSEKELILLNVRLYLRCPISYRHLEEMMLERNFKADHTIIFRCVQAYSPEMDSIDWTT